MRRITAEPNSAMTAATAAMPTASRAPVAGLGWLPTVKVVVAVAPSKYTERVWVPMPSVFT